MTWFFTHLGTVAILFLFVVAGVSCGVAKYEMAANVTLKAEISRDQDQLKQAAKDQQIATQVSHDYETQLSALNGNLASSRMRASLCIVPTAAAGGHDGVAGTKPLGSHGISSDWLYSYAAEAEKYRLQLLACQKWAAGISSASH